MASKSRLSSTTKRSSGRVAPLHPGEVLREEFMIPLALSSNRLALDLRVPATRITEIVNQRRGITADTALRLARYFRTTPEFWMNMQSQYDLEIAADLALTTIERDVLPMPARALGVTAAKREASA